jgi:hypothetical protein
MSGYCIAWKDPERRHHCFVHTKLCEVEWWFYVDSRHRSCLLWVASRERATCFPTQQAAEQEMAWLTPRCRPGTRFELLSSQGCCSLKRTGAWIETAKPALEPVSLPPCKGARVGIEDLEI